MKPSEQLQAEQRAELESAFALSQTLFRGFERMTQLQMQVMRDMAQHAADGVEATLKARDLQTLPNTQAQNALWVSGEGAMSYLQKLVEIVSATQTEMADTLNASLRRLQTSLQASARQGIGAGPASAESVQALFQSAVRFTAQAAEAMQTAQQQATRLITDQVQSLAPAARKAPASPRKRRN